MYVLVELLYPGYDFLRRHLIVQHEAHGFWRAHYRRLAYSPVKAGYAVLAVDLYELIVAAQGIGPFAGIICAEGEPVYNGRIEAFFIVELFGDWQRYGELAKIHECNAEPVKVVRVLCGDSL